mgnify:CR=1 FL=1
MKVTTIPELRRLGRAWDWIAIQIQDERNEAVRLLNAERTKADRLRETLSSFAELTVYVSEKGLGKIGDDVVPVVIGLLDELERLQRSGRGELMQERDYYRDKAAVLADALTQLRQRQGKSETVKQVVAQTVAADMLQNIIDAPSRVLGADIGWLQIAAGECPVDDVEVLRAIAAIVCQGSEGDQ